jgi:tRNA-specific 2-thiouridylase
VGQRRGLALGGGPARYVLRVLNQERQVVVGDESQLFSDRLEVRAPAWCGPVPEQPFQAEVRVRYRHAGARARVFPGADSFRVEFESAQRAITPGQAAVVYAGDEVVGGGIIAS